MIPISYADAVDIGHGRGRLAPVAAASVRRIDAQLGRPADVNEGWRSPDAANQNRARWIAYQNGAGPAAPYALGADESVHCAGEAADSDDWYAPHAAAVWRDNGWRQTALYPVGDRRREPWHGEHFPALDNHRDTTAGGASSPLLQLSREDDDMMTIEGPDRRITAVAPGYHKVLNDEEWSMCGAITTRNVIAPTTRHFDVWLAMFIQGTLSSSDYTVATIKEAIAEATEKYVAGATKPEPAA